jgi:hypothetical protein
VNDKAVDFGIFFKEIKSIIDPKCELPVILNIGFKMNSSIKKKKKI